MSPPAVLNADSEDDTEAVSEENSLNSPRQRVIRSAPLCYSPNHTAPDRSPHRNGPCLLDGIAPSTRIVPFLLRHP